VTGNPRVTRSKNRLKWFARNSVGQLSLQRVVFTFEFVNALL